MAVAMKSCGATVKERAMENRIERYQKHHAPADVNLPTAAEQDSTGCAAVSSNVITPQTWSKANGGKGVLSLVLASKVVDAALDSMSSWLSRETIARHKRKEMEITRDNFAKKANKTCKSYLP